MNIYKFKQDINNYSWLTTAEEKDVLFNLDFVGVPIRNGWKKIPIKINTDSHLKNRPIGDFPTMGTSTLPIISEKGKTHLSQYMSTKVEFLPLEFEHNQFFAVNVINVIDALDMEQSSLKKYDDHILDIIDYEFYPTLIKNEDIIFKVKQKPNGNILVTDLFLDLVDKYKLEGLACIKVWSLSGSMGRSQQG